MRRLTNGSTIAGAFWESYTQALIGAIKRCDGGVSITMVTKLNFPIWQNTAGGKIVTRVFASPATDG